MSMVFSVTVVIVCFLLELFAKLRQIFQTQHFFMKKCAVGGHFSYLFAIDGPFLTFVFCIFFHFGSTLAQVGVERKCTLLACTLMLI
jgi:hypothetical protein